MTQRHRPAAAPATGVGVMHVINGEFYAGAERVQELLADRLPDFGYRAWFVCLKKGQFQRALAEGPHPCLALNMRSRLDVIRHARVIARHTRESGCRVLHSHTPRSALVSSLASVFAGIPMVHHVHSPTSRDSARAWLNAVNARVERAALLRATALLPVSRSLADELRKEGCRNSRITVIPNGVAISGEEPVSHGHGSLTVGTVALFRPRKGIEVLLEAISRLAARGLPVRVRAVGSFERHDYEQRVRGLCHRLGIEDRVEWRGFRRDVGSELRQMDLLALPSLFGEGMPMVVLEAMAVGLPVVATRVEGVPEVVRHGQEGLLVDPGDPEGLADAIGHVAAHRDTLRAMGMAGRRRQREEFSDVAMAQRLSRVYDRVLGLEPQRQAAETDRRPEGSYPARARVFRN